MLFILWHFIISIFRYFCIIQIYIIEVPLCFLTVSSPHILFSINFNLALFATTTLTAFINLSEYFHFAKSSVCFFYHYLNGLLSRHPNPIHLLFPVSSILGPQTHIIQFTSSFMLSLFPICSIFLFFSVVGRIMPFSPNDVCILIPGTCECYFRCQRALCSGN